MTAASDTTAPSLAIVGGGLAGLAAAAVAAEQGFRVEVFESRGRLGGRAGSFLDRPSGEWVDHCQHVSMGCCVNLADFCRRTGIDESFARYRRLHFLTAGGRQHSFSAATLLPAPLHLATGLLRLGYLSLPERWRIATGLVRLARKASPRRRLPNRGPVAPPPRTVRARDRRFLVARAGECFERDARPCLSPCRS